MPLNLAVALKRNISLRKCFQDRLEIAREDANKPGSNSKKPSLKCHVSTLYNMMEAIKVASILYSILTAIAVRKNIDYYINLTVEL